MTDTMYKTLFDLEDLNKEIFTDRRGRKYTAADWVDDSVEAKLHPIIAKEIQNMVNKMNEVMEMEE